MAYSSIYACSRQNFDSGRKDPGGWFTRLPQWEALPGGTKGAVIDFSADESKKAAVLSAFKVRPHSC